MSGHTYTKVLDKNDFKDAWDAWQCNDCGAYALYTEDIVHHKTCVPGESDRWADFYDQAYEEYGED